MGKKVVYLYSRYVENVRKAPESGAVCVDELTAGDLAGAYAAVYLPGAYYNDATFGVICEYYRNGGVLVLPGAKPLSQPYAVRGGAAVLGTQSVAALRALGPVEQHVPNGKLDAGCRTSVEDEAFAPLEKAVADGAFDGLRETWSLHYNLARTEKDQYGEYLQDARLDVAVRVRDAEGRCIAAPVTRVTHRSEGCLYLLNFAPEKADYYEAGAGRELLEAVVECALRPRVRVRFEPVYARYLPGEAAALRVEVLRLADPEAELTAEVVLKDAQTGEVKAAFPVAADGQCREVSLGELAEGQVAAQLRVCWQGACIEARETGFFVISDEELLARVRRYPRITLDTGKTADFFMQDGQLFAMHGTTHFVTDVYRDCFLHFNAAQCEKDLKALHAEGFNILRSGNWRLALEFYGPDGMCSTAALRALDAYFLLAAENGFTVQYVLGSAVLNDWDRSKDPLHNPEIREKVMNVMRTFTARYADFTNVQLDILNEPSYSWRGAWTLGRPSLDPHEKEHWGQWLEKKYGGDITALHDAWRVTPAQVPDFASAQLPENADFDRYVARTETDLNYCRVTDFFRFARESYSGWVKEIRDIARVNAPEMVVMMGRDESIRIPSQQDEIAAGNLDFVNWHQWGTNSISFMEYYLNKVRGVPCCGQELGVYQQEDGRGFKSLNDERRAAVLEKKLLYAFGNWLQWQAQDDPYLTFICETSLGMCRADGTETPSLRVGRVLAQQEEKMRPHLMGRDEDAIQCLTVHPTYYHFSMCNAMAVQGVRSHALTLHYRVKEQSDLVLEHLFTEENRSMWGNPKLIFVPCAQVMAQGTWELLRRLMEQGATVALSGAPERDEYFRRAERVGQLIPGAKAQPVYGVERIVIDGKLFDLDFRRAVAYADAGHGIERIAYDADEENAVRVVNVGKGKLVHCTLPLELAESADAVEAFYRLALREADVENAAFVCETGKPNVMIYPMVYADSVVYTLVNEGAKDAVAFTDKASGLKIETVLPAQRGCKLCLGKNGELYGYYAPCDVKIGETWVPANA